MADFVAVLKKTLDGLTDPTPALRQKVYAKARATIEAKLAAINPPPPQAVVDRQKRALEDAIATIEKDYSDHAQPKISEDPLQELESVFASIERQKNAPLKSAEPAAPPSAPEPLKEPVSEAAPEAPRREFASWLDTAPKTMPGAAAAATRPQEPEAPAPEAEITAAPKADDAAMPASPQAADVVEDDDDDLADLDRLPGADAEPTPSTASSSLAGSDPASDEFFHAAANQHEREEVFGEEIPERRRSYRGLIAAAAALVVIGGAGYGIWLNKDAFSGLFGGSGKETAAVAPKPLVDGAAKDDEAAAGAPTTASGEEPASQPATASGEPKFTQRLNADGTEADPGPAGGNATIGEGTSVAAATQAPQVTPPAGPQTPPPASGNPAQPSVAIGQRAIFYEERTSVAQGSAEPGNIVWSVVKESPGGDLPPEPAIRAEATIPGKDLQLRMTIRRNADQTLPASHIIEIIFLTPASFEGGGIENVLRVSMKSSEQEAGNPLIGIPAKIADGFFLIALNDGKPETEANMTLLRRQSWIDVPIVYKSGRRALFTMEKGLPGQKVFDEALKAWEAASASNSAG